MTSHFGHERRTAGRHIGRLTERRDWIAGIIAARERTPDDQSGGLGYYRAEMEALDWALPVLVEHHAALREEAGQREVERADAVRAARQEKAEEKAARLERERAVGA